MASIGAEAMQKLIQSGVDSPFLLARQQYAESATLLTHHLRPIIGQERVYPSMMIPQASGRVGISKPPLGNFTADEFYGPHGIRDVVRPDPGTKWICPDWNAVEAAIVSHRCKDPIDEAARRRGLDLHTVTAITMLKYPDPPVEPTKEALASSQGLEWRERVGFTERMRTLMKNCRYTLCYAHGGPNGEHAENAMDAYVTEMQMDKKEARAYGKQYLASKPWLVQFKRQRWESVWRAKVARTSFGRRRLFPITDARLKMHVEKEGLNHEIQGTVADLMKHTMVALSAMPGVRMVLQRHDGWYSEVPEDWDQLDAYKAIVEREWIIDQRPITFQAEYKTIYA